MKTSLETAISPEAYLKAERNRLEKHEYLNGTILKMSGASLDHNRIVSQLHRLLGALLEGQNFEIFQSDLRIRNELANSFTYPDIVVIQGEPELYADTFDTVTNPIFIVEVLSKSTQQYDLTDKFIIYRQLESLQEYLLVEQDKKQVYRYLKETPKKWTIETFTPEDNVNFELISLGISLPFEAIYKGVKLK